MMKEEIAGFLVLRKEGGKPPLFCIHGSGGGGFAYEDLATLLPQDQPVYAFSLPPLENTIHLPTVYDLASRYLSQIRNIQSSGPYQLCGHSFGGYVAYEIACRLMEGGQHVGVVALLDTPNPVSYRNMPLARKLQFHIVYLSNRVARYGGNLLRGKVNQIVADATVTIRRRGSRFAWRVARAAFSNSPRTVSSIIHSDALVLDAASSAFTPRQYRGDIVLFRASIRDVEYKRDATMGWAECVSGCIHVQQVEGDHRSIMFLPNVKGIADLLASWLAVSYDNEGSAPPN